VASNEINFFLNLPISSRCGIRIVIGLDLEVVKNNGHLLIGLGQKEVRAVRIRRIIGGVSRTVQFSALLRAAHIGETAGSVRSRCSRNFVLRLEGVLALKATTLQLPRAEDHG